MLSDNIAVCLGYASDSLLSSPDYSIWKLFYIIDKEANEVVIPCGSGYGTFTHYVNYSTDDHSEQNSIAVGDFNQDHQLDIAVGNNGTNNIGVFLGNPNGNFSSPRSLAVGYFDNDTLLDIAVANYGTNKIAIFLGYTHGSFRESTFLSISVSFWQFEQKQLD
ncbi:unnamed protein product [Rotaria magnacalcarata]|uniref:Uncharacterized protein n=1 Tax=Rotaria magnacalcarata TaxID=392030 RepID=A0A815NLH4_9BILA|nr:unnamed protein product [Rotaria magnacalcarata]CAF1564662.1 unnamed protein product [Rotaria magnacalcarata]CAF2096148.1 unnamed protein product [Rotaria magnacalcarata]CAF2146731.1 unnamed protein product [Rotaria magnacalcarata]CAF3968389.1 unnamed protein product [Rotaria magnacalcarata]